MYEIKNESLRNYVIRGENLPPGESAVFDLSSGELSVLLVDAGKNLLTIKTDTSIEVKQPTYKNLIKSGVIKAESISQVSDKIKKI